MADNKFTQQDESLHSSLPEIRILLLPYAGLLILYLLVIGCGSAWLYYSARQAQTELLTEHIIEIVKPFLKQLSAEYQQRSADSEPFLLSKRVIHLYQTLPHLRQISIRDRQRGYGVRLNFNQQLVDVELEPLRNPKPIETDHRQLASQLHQQTTSPFFHITLNLTAEQSYPVQMDIAFDRAALVGQIRETLKTIIHSIIGFSLIGFLSTLLAVAITIYSGFRMRKMDKHLQKIYLQASMGTLSAKLVHDLRNPLASIRANIKNLLITPEETEQVIDEMDQDILRLEQKLSDFLSLTKPRVSGFEAIDIKSLMQDVVKKSKPLFEEKNITISMQIESSIPLIMVIQQDLTDALFNILVNAKNHTQEQGHVWVKVHCNQGELEISIEDDGSGIQESLLTKIFEPFFTTRENGHGLGLAIVKRTIEAHKGNIFAENRLPSGARIIISLPILHNE